MTDKKYKLLLIRPFQKFKHYSTQKQLAYLMGRKVANTPLALPLLAALTPDNYDIRIADEEIGPLPKNYTPDIVGITLITSNVERGYEIAQYYKKTGAKIIFGGPYASYAPNEGLQHADTVVIGEAEEIWKDVLNDFESDKLKEKYQAKTIPAYKNSVVPRWDLIPKKKLLTLNVQASRGCPFQCEFCLTSQMFGRKMRFREIDDVINEIKQLPLKNVFFCDDNLTINKQYALDLFEKLKPLNISWMCQSSVDVADDMDFLKKMSEAGCKFILIGFESVNENSLEETHKHQNNKDRYIEIIQRIHSVGIHVYGSFIIGFDNDTKEDFSRFSNFIQEAQLPVFMLSILGTTKGTELHERLLKEDRVYKNISKNYNIGSFPVFQYKNFTNEEILNGLYNTLDDLYSFENIRKRTIPLLEKGSFSIPKPQGSVTFWQKFNTTIILFFNFKLSRNAHKRMLWKDIIRLIKHKKLAINEAASLLLMLESISRHLHKEKNQRKHFFKELETIDPLYGCT